MRQDRPQDVGEELELRDDQRVAARRKRAADGTPPHLDMVRNFVLLETDDFVTIPDVAKSLNIPRSAAAVCLGFLKEEGLLVEHEQLPSEYGGSRRGSSPGYWGSVGDETVEICGERYSMHGGSWMARVEEPNGKFKRVARSSLSRTRNNRNAPQYDVLWKKGSWDGRAFVIRRHKEFRAAAERRGFPPDPTAGWRCPCGKQGVNEKKCYKCGAVNPRLLAMGWSDPDASRGPQRAVKPEVRTCTRCGGEARVKRRSGKVVSVGHSRSVCNSEVARRVLAM